MCFSNSNLNLTCSIVGLPIPRKPEGNSKRESSQVFGFASSATYEGTSVSRRRRCLTQKKHVECLFFSSPSLYFSSQCRVLMQFRTWKYYGGNMLTLNFPAWELVLSIESSSLCQQLIHLINESEKSSGMNHDL